jgi:hypothetical protein
VSKKKKKKFGIKNMCLGLYAILVFPRFLIAVKCAVAGSLIATGV